VEYLKRLVIVFRAFIAIIIIGILGFIYLEKYTLLEAAWLTITTLATVGYGNFVPQTVAGQIFNLILIVVGVGVMAYTLAEFVALVVEGHLQDIMGRRQMQRKIERLGGHIIVCGAGRIGENVINRLSKEQVAFVVVEVDEKTAQHLAEEGYLVIQGDASEDSVLEQAGIKRARGLITALSDDADNVFVTLTAKGLNPNLFVVAKADQKATEGKLKRAGANRVILPAAIGGIKMAAVVLKPFITDFIDTVLHESAMPLEMEEIRVNPASDLESKIIKFSRIKEESGALIVAIKRGEKIITNPDVEEVILAGDRLIAIGSSEQLGKLEQLAGFKK